MSEANFSLTIKVNGDLFTIRGTTLDEFTMNLGGVLESATGLIGDIAVLQAAGHAAQLTQPQQPQYQRPAQQPAAPQFPSNAQPAQPQQAGHVCQCGFPMKLRNGQYGSFYSCSKPMNDPTRCKQTINV